MTNIQYRFTIYFLTFDGISYQKNSSELIISDSCLAAAISRLIDWFDKYHNIARFTYKVTYKHNMVSGFYYDKFTRPIVLYSVDENFLMEPKYER